MTRSRLIQQVASCASIAERDADAVVRTVFETMSQALARGDRIEMRGFGTFSVRQRQARSARSARNPRTGEAVQTVAKKVVYFRPGRWLGRLINGDADAALREQQREQSRRFDDKRG